MYQKAVELDPKFALAYAKLSEAHSSMYWFHFDHTKDRLIRAKTAVDEALRLDPGLPDAHASLRLPGQRREPDGGAVFPKRATVCRRAA